MDNNNKPIGFLDSGVGGLSVMKEAIKIMPNENYIYFGDSKNAPYGVKSTKEIRDLTFKAVEFLISKGIKGLVVACNTATSAAVRELRTVYPDMPAVELGRDGKILIMATPMTIKQDKFKLLLDKYKDKAEIVPIPCAGLMEFIESGVLDGIELEYYLKEKLSDYSSENVSSVVLGCTHYPFVKDSISKILGKNVEVIDGGEGTAREIKRRLAEKNLLNTNTTKGKIEIYNSLREDKIIDLSWKLLS